MAERARTLTLRWYYWDYLGKCSYKWKDQLNSDLLTVWLLSYVALVWTCTKYYQQNKLHRWQIFSFHMIGAGRIQNSLTYVVRVTPWNLIFEYLLVFLKPNYMTQFKTVYYTSDYKINSKIICLGCQKYLL